MEGARFLALLLYFEGRVEGRGAIAPLKRDALRKCCPLYMHYGARPWVTRHKENFTPNFKTGIYTHISHWAWMYVLHQSNIVMLWL